MTEHLSLKICQPCRDGHHLECDGSKELPCACLICEGERIGDREAGELSDRRWR